VTSQVNTFRSWVSTDSTTCSTRQVDDLTKNEFVWVLAKSPDRLSPPCAPIAVVLPCQHAAAKRAVGWFRFLRAPVVVVDHLGQLTSQLCYLYLL